jgi:hypothetical protein
MGCNYRSFYFSRKMDKMVATADVLVATIEIYPPLWEEA